MKYVTEMQEFGSVPGADGILNAKRMLCTVYHWRMVGIVKEGTQFFVYFEGEPKTLDELLLEEAEEVQNGT